MASGTKKMVINSRERAVSADINRLQDFQQAALAEVLRHLLLASTTDANAGGLAVVPSAAASPMPAIILDGFMCRPSLSTDGNPLDLYIDAGAMFVVDTDTAPGADDSVGKIARDSVGMQTAGAIQFLAVAASTRVDVVEVARVDPSDPSTIVETANRDIYNPTTGAFTATSVTKATDGKLQYRIRRGGEGAGFPGTASKWLPLMVAVVPLGATNWDGVTCFDVRPLLADHADFANMLQTRPQICDSRATVSGTTLKGSLRGRYSNALAGGQLPVGGVDLALASTASWILNASSYLLNLYAAFPNGLPRWCQYAAAPAARLPGGFRGILCGSTVRTDLAGNPVSAIALPAALTALGATTTSATIVGALAGNGLGGGSGAIIATLSDGDWTKTSSAHAIANSGSGGAGVNAYWQFTLDDSTGDYPASARALALEFDILMTSGISDGSTNIDVEVEVDGVRYGGMNLCFKDPVASTTLLKVTFEVPLKQFFPDSVAPQTGGSARVIKFYNSGYLVGAGFPTHAVTMKVKGWKL